MGAGAVTGNEQVSSLSDQLFQAAMLSSFIPQGTMDKMKEKFAPMKDKIVNSSIGQKIANSKMAGRFDVAKVAAGTFKGEAAASVASRGLMKSLPMLATGALRVGFQFTKMIPVVGWVIAGLDALYTVATLNAKAQEEISKAIVETLTMTKDKLDKLNEFFGSDAKLSGIRTATVAGVGQTGEQASLAEQFRQSDQFKSVYKDQAEKLKGASNQQFAITMQSLGLDLYGQGMSEEQVQIIIDAIKKEAGQTDVVLNFKDLKLDTETGKANLAKSLKEITSGAIKEFESNRDWGYINWEAQANLDEYEAQVTGFLSAMSQEFVNGRISAQEFNGSWDNLLLSVNKMDAANPGDGMAFLTDTMARLNPELEKATGFMEDATAKAKILKLAMLGIQVPQELINDLSANPLDATANAYAQYLEKFAVDKSKNLDKQKGIIKGISQQQKNLQKQEGGINDLYEKRIKALERINALNEAISNKQKGQLDLADALSQGDVFRAAQAMQQIRADEAKVALEQQKNALEDQKDKKVSSLQDKADNLDSALTSAQDKLTKIQDAQPDAYKSTLKAPNLEDVYSKVGWIYRMAHPLLWLSSEADVKTAMGKDLKGLAGLLGPLGQGLAKANGGYISGPGSGTSDSIPARLSNGEYVIRAKAVNALGTDVLDKMNHADKFAKGGYVNTNSLSGILSASKKGMGKFGDSNRSSLAPKEKSWEENTLKWFEDLGAGIAGLPGIKQFGEYYMKPGDSISGLLRATLGTLSLPVNLVGGMVNSQMAAQEAYNRGDWLGGLLESSYLPGLGRALASSYSGVIDPSQMQSSQFSQATDRVIKNKWFGATDAAGVARAKLFGGAMDYLADPTMYLGIGAATKIASAAKIGSKAKNVKVAKTFTGVGSNTELNKIVSSTFTKNNVKVGEELYPTYNVGKGKFAFQGYGQELPGVLSATGVKVVPTTPEGLLEAAIGLNPKDKALKVMLKNFKENKIGQKELDLLDNIHASVSINKKGKVTEFERADGLATMLSALSGNKTAKGIIDFKTQKLKDAVAAQDARQVGLFEQFNKDKLVGENQVATPANVAFVRSLHGPLEFDKNGNALVYSASNFRKDYARSSIHGTADSIVSSHSGGSWDPMATKVVSPLSEMIKANGLPRSMDVADTWWLRNPGQPLLLPKGTFSQIRSFDSNTKLSAELVKRGIINPGDTVPIISSDPATKEVFRLVKENVEDYTEAQKNLLFSQYKRGLLPEYNISDTLDEIALDIAKKQHGINTGYQGSLNGDIFSNTARTQEINNLATSLGVRTGSKAHSNSIEAISERDIYSRGKNDRTGELGRRISSIDTLELIRTVARLGHFKGQVINPRIIENRQSRSGFGKGILGLAKGGLVNIPHFKNGGMFRTGYADGGLALLHDKEFVMNPGAVREYGVGNLKAMNNGTYNSGSVYNSYGVNINVGGSNSNASDIARTVIREIKKIDSQQIRSTRI
jgi:hypothetical protein